MKVVAVEAVALSLDLSDRAVTLGVGTAVKKDTVIVIVRTEDGIVGYGEAHHALAPTVVADLVNTNLAPLVVGEDALAVEHVWEKLYVSRPSLVGGPSSTASSPYRPESGTGSRRGARSAAPSNAASIESPAGPRLSSRKRA